MCENSNRYQGILRYFACKIIIFTKIQYFQENALFHLKTAFSAKVGNFYFLVKNYISAKLTSIFFEPRSSIQPWARKSRNFAYFHENQEFCEIR